MLDTEFAYFLEHQEELVKKYNGKFIVIKEEQIVGEYDDLGEAYEKSKKIYEVGTFLIQHCIAGDAAYKQTFNSRAVFS